MDSFNIIWFFGVAQNKKIRVTHFKKNTTSTIQIFFSVIYIYIFVAISSKKRK